MDLERIIEMLYQMHSHDRVSIWNKYVDKQEIPFAHIYHMGELNTVFDTPINAISLCQSSIKNGDFSIDDDFFSYEPDCVCSCNYPDDENSPINYFDLAEYIIEFKEDFDNEDIAKIIAEQAMPEKIQCTYCEQEFDPQDILHDHIQRPICKECLEKTYVKCSKCGKICSEGLYQKMNNGDVLCEKCFERHAFVCDDCHGIFYTEDDAFIVGDDGGYTVCSNCFQNYYKCDYCGEWHEDVHEVQRGDGAEPECVCERCIRNHPHAQTKINVEPDTKEVTAPESAEEQTPVLLQDLLRLFSHGEHVSVTWYYGDDIIGNWGKFSEYAPVLARCLSDAFLKAKVISVTLEKQDVLVLVEKPDFMS